MEKQFVNTLLVTANCGSVFEDPNLLEKWIAEFVGHVSESKPDFVALHLQEVGGKTYEKSMEYVQQFIKMLCEAEEFEVYDRIRVYLDEDYNSAEHFTALGNLYFASKTIKSLNMWNFLTHEWESVSGKNIHTGNIETVPTKEKSKFPQNFFPECKWSRKGFLRTRWSINGSVLDLVNIHLFHDASNLAACQEYPSVYCKSRRRALLHTLERFHQDDVNVPVPYFIFGDFNFRVDTAGVIKELTEDLTMHRVQNVKSDSTKVHYRNSEGHNVLTVGKKEFSHTEHQTKFKEEWLRKFDLELEPIKEFLYEYPITFAPSYPYEENIELPYNYMSTRCPSWCDRVLISPAARKLIIDDEGTPQDLMPTYGIIGANICMGDHKPVYLSIRIKIEQGIVSCYGEHENTTNNYDASDTELLVTSSNNNNKINNRLLNIQNNVVDVLLVNKSVKNNSFNNLQSFQLKNNPKHNLCLLCRKHFFNRIAHIYSQDNSNENSIATSNSSSNRAATNNIHNNISNNSNNNSTSSQKSHTPPVRPLISINVIDTENLSVCMCSLYNSRNNSEDNLLQSKDLGNSGPIPTLLTPDKLQITDEANNICPICRNIIKKQPSERKTLISKRLLLANDIIVNRIDSHYLNTFSGINFKQDPYTPESPDSCSPNLESDSSDTNRDSDDRNKGDDEDQGSSIDVNNTTNNNNTSRSSCGVSPSQLKSRLERLRQLSVTEASDDEDDEKQKQQIELKPEESKDCKEDVPCCSGKECSIL